MWSNLPSDLLSHIFSFLSPDSLARSSSACRHWHACSKRYPPSSLSRHRHPPWFLALPIRTHKLCCYAYNPILRSWYVLPLSFLPSQLRPVAPLGTLLLLRPTNSTLLKLDICNPFTKQFKHLPPMNIARTNPAVAVVIMGLHAHLPHFLVYVAGGMSEAQRGGVAYESALEMYDSHADKWSIVGSTPTEFAVRLTVWTPNESVYCSGVLYWVTSARAYSVMGFHIGTHTWREVSVPMASQLEFAALGRHHGKLMLVGGTCRGDTCVWELGEGDKWEVIERVPMELKARFVGEMGSWSNTKCVSNDACVCLYKDLGTGMLMLMWSQVSENGKSEWFWVDGCGFIRGNKVGHNVPIKGVLIHPILSPWP